MHIYMYLYIDSLLLILKINGFCLIYYENYCPKLKTVLFLILKNFLNKKSLIVCFKMSLLFDCNIYLIWKSLVLK